MCDLCNGAGWMLVDNMATYCECPAGKALKKGHGKLHDEPAEEKHKERQFKDADDVPF